MGDLPTILRSSCQSEVTLLVSSSFWKRGLPNAVQLQLPFTLAIISRRKEATPLSFQDLCGDVGDRTFWGIPDL